MKILISGSSGLIGKHLTSNLTEAGHEVIRLVRKKDNQPGTCFWDIKNQEIDSACLEGIDAAIHLAGESIGDSRWTAATKKRIMDSRVEGTRLLCQTLAGLNDKPKTLISASAIGYYGHQPGVELTEEGALGSNFVADVCKNWEEETKYARDAGIRVVNMRIGIVLAPNGGPLHKMMTPFKFGAGGIIGNGKQYWSWVAIDDILGIVQFLLENESISGPVNAVSPNAASNYEMTKTLGKVMHRPTIMPLPGFAAKIVLGQMADELLLADAKVIPAKLQQAGYEFKSPELEATLKDLLGK